MDATEAFEEIKQLFAESGYKIFTPSGKYNKITPAFVAIRPDSRKRSACLIRIYTQHIQVGWQWPQGQDKEIEKQLAEFGKLIKKRPRLIARFRSDDWSTLPFLIQKSQRDELSSQIFDTQLT